MVWFVLELAEGITLTTDPNSAPTQWKQTLFYFKKPMQVGLGARIEGDIVVTPLPLNHRALQMQF